MEDIDKSKEQLLEEISVLRARLGELESASVDFLNDSVSPEDQPESPFSVARSDDPAIDEVPFLTTRSIDLSRILEEDVTDSGSFDLRGIRGSSLGMLLDALTIPALLVAEDRNVWFSNRFWSRSVRPSEKTEGISFEDLFPDSATAHVAVSNLNGTLRDRRSRIFDAMIEYEEARLWSRFHMRSVRISARRYILVLIEDRTMVMNQLLSNKKHRAELETRVKERTAELRELNLKLTSEIVERKRIEAAIQKSKDTIEALLNASTDIAALIDADGDILAVNRRGATACGKKINELIGEASCGFLPNVSSPRRAAAFQQVIETGRPVRFQDETDGRIFDHTYYPVSGPSTDVGAVAAFARDVTDRIRAEDALRDSEEKYRLVVENTNEMILIIQRGVIEFANIRAVQQCGYSRSELASRIFLDFVHPADRAVVKHHQGRILKPGETAPPYSCRMIDREGNTWWSHVGSVGISWKERPANLVFGTDITELKLAETALRESEEKYRDLAEMLPQLVYEIDIGGAFTFINRSGLKTLGYSAQDIVDGVRAVQMVVAGDREAFEKKLKQILLGSEGSSTEFTLVGDSDRLIPAIVNLSPIVKDETITGIRGVATDITERKKSEERVKKSLAEKEILLREIHHRVKNNLQVMSSLLRLQSYHIKEKEHLSMFKEAEDRVRSMALFHEKLYQSESLAEIGAAEYISGLLSNLTQSYGRLGDQISLVEEVDDVTLGIDSAIPLGFIVTELYSNALKHAFPDLRKGSVRVSLRTLSEGEFELIVADDGVGIPEHVDLENPGTFGLDIVWTFVKQLRGVVEAKRDRGSEFRVTFSDARSTGAD